jgi:rubrerythrin
MAGERVTVLELRDHLQSHVENEEAILNEYIEATDGTKSKALRYLVDLIANDERRHHQIFSDLAETLQYQVGVEGPELVVPDMDFDKADGAATSEIIDRLLRFELEDKRELKELRKKLKAFEDWTLHGLLVELMQRDTEKHIAILKFAKKHTNRNRQPR